MLDYKIKELKKQIEPREVEILEMREQIRQMDVELETYHGTNSTLELALSDLRLRLDGLQREVVAQRTKLGDAGAQLRAFKSDLHEAIQVRPWVGSRARGRLTRSLLCVWPLRQRRALACEARVT